MAPTASLGGCAASSHRADIRSWHGQTIHRDDEFRSFCDSSTGFSRVCILVWERSLPAKNVALPCRICQDSRRWNAGDFFWSNQDVSYVTHVTRTTVANGWDEQKAVRCTCLQQ